VDDALWTAAHAAMERQRERYSRNSPNGAPPWSIGARYLLTGLLRCAVCGAGLEARSRSHGNRRVVFYGCSAYHRRACSVCRNRLTVPMDLANDAVLLELKSGLLNPRVLKAAVARVARRLCSARGDTYVSAVRRELAAVEQEFANLATAVAAGVDVPSILAAIRSREAQRRVLLDQLAHHVEIPDLDPASVLAELQARLTD
jgi:hypothetical protein